MDGFRNLFNIDAPSFFSDVVNDFDLASPIGSLLLTGSSESLKTWQVGDRVHTNSLAGTPNPPGASLYRSSVTGGDGFLTSEDVIAFANLAQPAVVAVLSPADQVSQMLDEVNSLVVSGVLTQGHANGLVAKLTAIHAKIHGGHSGAARNQLGAFANQVSAFVRIGVLPQTQAQHLLDAAAYAAAQL